MCSCSLHKPNLPNTGIQTHRILSCVRKQLLTRIVSWTPLRHSYTCCCSNPKLWTHQQHSTLPFNHTNYTKMFFTSPTSNITPASVSVAMSRSDSRDSSTSTSSYTSQPLYFSYSPSSTSYRSNSITSMGRESFSSGWLPSPYRSCMMHSSSSSQGYEFSSSNSYISDDDLLALVDLAMPPIEQIPTISSQTRPQPPKREMTTEEQIAMLRDMQDREQAQQQQQRQRAQQQRTVRFATEQRKPRRSSNMSTRRTTTATTSTRRS